MTVVPWLLQILELEFEDQAWLKYALRSHSGRGSPRSPWVPLPSDGSEVLICRKSHHKEDYLSNQSENSD